MALTVVSGNNKHMRQNMTSSQFGQHAIQTINQEGSGFVLKFLLRL